MATTPGREKSASVARRDSWLNRREEAPPVAPPKTITVIGAGHVGVPHAVTIAKKCPGVKVTVVDDDARKIAGWNSSLLPFYEPGLQETLEDVRGTNLFFTTDMEKAIDSAPMATEPRVTPHDCAKTTPVTTASAVSSAHIRAVAGWSWPLTICTMWYAVE